MGVQEKPIITAFNKQDRLEETFTVRDFKADDTVKISARTGEGLYVLQEKLENVLRQQKVAIEQMYSYREAGKIQLIRKYGELIEEEYLEEGILVKAYVPVTIYDKVRSV